MDTVKATQLKPDGMATTGKTRLWHIALVTAEPSRHIPNSLRTHRHTQEQRTAASAQLRAQLARTKVAQVTRHQVQRLFTAMLQEQRGEDGNQADGQYYQPASLHNERALLRAFFNYANRIWSWTVPGGNPASGLVMPEVDNERTRVLTNAEWRRLMAALQDYDNPYVIPLVSVIIPRELAEERARERDRKRNEEKRRLAHVKTRPEWLGAQPCPNARALQALGVQHPHR